MSSAEQARRRTGGAQPQEGQPMGNVADAAAGQQGMPAGQQPHQQGSSGGGDGRGGPRYEGGGTSPVRDQCATSAATRCSEDTRDESTNDASASAASLLQVWTRRGFQVRSGGGPVATGSPWVSAQHRRTVCVMTRL
eukprot:2083848-Pyramimonas_sp.AAC.1